MTRYFTTSAKPGEPPDRGPAPAPPRPPWWRVWLLPVGFLITFLLFSIPQMTTTPTKKLDYSTFLSEVDSNKIDTASINPGGAISGNLKNGDHYTSQIPTAINDSQLAPTLKAHHVAVTGVGPGSAVLAALLSLLPFLLFVVFFIWMGRRGRRALQASWGSAARKPRSTTSKSL